MKRVATCILFSLLMSPATALAQKFYSHSGPEVPQVPLWGEEANGDAVQKDLGFILPKKWKEFDRYRFSSTRADGGSVKTWYQSPDKQLTINILIQLRLDVRGMDLGDDFAWNLLKLSGAAEMGLESGKKPVELSSGPFSLGGRQPPGKMQWTRYDLADGPKVQGLWWQNIGIWSVVITAAGPEARKAEVEKAGATLIAEMPFPHAPAAAEFMAKGPKLFAAMPPCTKDLPEGKGTASKATMEDAVKVSLIIPSFVLDNPKTAPISPITSAPDYCLMERFKSSKGEVTAVRYTGKPNEFWDANYGFALDSGRNGYLQFDRNTALKSETSNGAILTYSDRKQVTAYALYTDWPSYKESRNAVEAIFEKAPNAIARVSHPASKVYVQVDTGSNPPLVK
jgi:hypothetical protein